MCDQWKGGKFAFKPRPELSINANMIDQEKTSLEGPEDEGYT
jgi:hypothetical protein